MNYEVSIYHTCNPVICTVMYITRIQKTITVGTVMIKRMCTENVTLGQIIHLLEVYIYK